MTALRENNRLASKWERSEATFSAFAAKHHVPLGGTFELTPRCSLRCKMCYIRLDKTRMKAIGNELTAHEWINVAQDAIKAGTLNLLITGGEPMIRDDFEEIYSALSTMGFIIKLNTNATLITPDVIRLLSKYPPTVTCVTLYGASPETYEKVCGDGDGFERTIRGLELLSKIPTELEVRTTFIKDNMNELDELRTIANRYTQRFGINTDVFKPVRGAASEAETCRLTADEISNVVSSNLGYYNRFSNDNESNVFLDESKEEVTKKDLGFQFPPEVLKCLAAKSMYWITWDGKMLPCGCFSEPFTLPLEEGFQNAWNRLPGLLENASKPIECLQCEVDPDICPNCLAKLQAETGSFDKVASYICEIAHQRSKRSGK